MQRRLGIAIALLTILVGCSATAAQRILAQEPPPGTLKAGATVLVDDGSCGPGKIKKVVGGSNIGGAGPGAPRQTLCIPRK
ncbi:MAG TPA: DUF6719 family protein [Xanthobacteraceae bacterium]|jgi:hypothetical protein